MRGRGLDSGHGMPGGPSSQKRPRRPPAAAAIPAAAAAAVPPAAAAADAAPPPKKKARDRKAPPTGTGNKAAGQPVRVAAAPKAAGAEGPGPKVKALLDLKENTVLRSLAAELKLPVRTNLRFIAEGLAAKGITPVDVAERKQRESKAVHAGTEPGAVPGGAQQEAAPLRCERCYRPELGTDEATVTAPMGCGGLRLCAKCVWRCKGCGCTEFAPCGKLAHLGLAANEPGLLPSEDSYLAQRADIPRRERSAGAPSACEDCGERPPTHGLQGAGISSRLRWCAVCCVSHSGQILPSGNPVEGATYCRGGRLVLSATERAEAMSRSEAMARCLKRCDD